MATQTPDACLSVDFIGPSAYFAATSKKKPEMTWSQPPTLFGWGEIATRQQGLPTGAIVDAISVATDEDEKRDV